MLLIWWRQAVANATRPYRPHNAAEGIWFMSQFCDQCKRDAAYQAGEGDSCPIVAATMSLDQDDPAYPPEWIEDPNPCCTAFEALDRPAGVR